MRYQPCGRRYGSGIGRRRRCECRHSPDVSGCDAHCFRIAQSEILEREMELQIQAEITQAWFCHEAEKKKVAQLKAGILEDSQKVLEGMVYKYKRGEINILDVLVAQRTYNEVQQEYLETMKGYVASLVELEKTCGIWDIRF